MQFSMNGNLLAPASATLLIRKHLCGICNLTILAQAKAILILVIVASAQAA